MLTTTRSAGDERAFELARDTIAKGPNRELAVRLLLVEIFFTSDRESVQLLTNDRSSAEPPSLALIDGEPPRLVRETRLEPASVQAGIERFLRQTVPLTTAWLERRVALLSRHDADLVKLLRQRIAAGLLPGALGQLAPPVVVLEAVRRKGTARDRLIADLLAPPPGSKIEFDKEPERLIDCGLGAQLVNPLGRRFANVFTGRRRAT